MGGIDNKIKIFLFHLIALTPLFVLIFIAAHFALGVMSVKTVDHLTIKHDIEDYLRAERGKFSFTREGDELNGAYDYRLKNVSYKPEKVRFDLSSVGAEKIIYVFGSSPLVSRLFHQSENILFPEKLEEKLNSRSAASVKVHNFGVVSYDSYEIKEMAKALVAEKKPDIIVFYEGHMDYEAAYMAAVKPRFFVLRRGLYLKALDYIVGHRFGGLYKFFMVGDWILRSAVEPNLLNVLQRTGILAVDPGPFEGYDRLILDHYKKNLEEIAELSVRSGVPLVIVTPIANMEAKPFGAYGVTGKY